jgi:DNA-binding MarR family transcriptional regulator
MSSAKSRPAAPATSPTATTSKLSGRLVQAFARFLPGYLRWSHSHPGREGLSYPRFRLLGVLHCRGPRIMSELSGELGVTARNVTALVDALEAEKLVERRPHPTDRRATVVALTGRGARTCATFWEQNLGAMSELFEELSERDQKELLRLLERLMGGLRERGFLDELPAEEASGEGSETRA